ncbi:HD domain-containing protein [Fructobacillus sp. M1-13]|uniref:HD domain-containing protein n=1 Tax=Fructobacillus papyriferae TaxID=2713171 RepID=A0ABS5QQJ4_9LACO|nr:HD domain-containing protein [Fructobacillus papyriferae]MBS9335470.1 HD domain-containing protein [Fructobacillus papyriferae]MCD2159240.1 HD domain-containing protein [Fructobacillus papyriferae]
MLTIAEFSKQTLAGDASGHDWYHAKRVADWALRLYEEDNGPATKETTAILRAGGLLHDTIDDKVVSDVLSQIKKVEKLLRANDFSKEATDEVMDTIQNLSYSANLVKQHELSKRGQYVQDADRIEALGAIGIARVFAYGGSKGRVMADPKVLPVTELKDKATYRQNANPSVNHFYEKLFKLPAQLNTTAGRKEGDKRAEYMKDFLRTFNDETGLLADPAFNLEDKNDGCTD